MSRTEVSPTKALDAHVAVIRAFRHPSHGKALLGSLTHVAPGPGIDEIVGEMAKDLADKLDRAATIVVTQQMMELVLRRMKSVPFGQPLEEADLPFESGFVLLPKVAQIALDESDLYDPLLTPKHVRVEMSGGAWVRGEVGRAADHSQFDGQPRPGIQFMQFVPRDRLPNIGDGSVEEIKAGQEVLRSMGMPHIPLYLTGWEFGLTWDPQYREESFVLTAAGEWERRFWHALWRTLSEEIVAPVSLPRQNRRAAARLGLTPDVVVAQLRRVRHPSGEERLPTGETIMWTHRWRVRGHERTLHRGTPQERKVPVRGYIKGPKNMPLIEKDRVWRLSR